MPKNMSWGVMGGYMGGWGLMELEGWRKGPWTAEEDRLLVDYVSLHGEGRWNSVARLAGLRRNGKSCRLRWVNYLRPDLKRGQITAQEESIILELHARWGNRWSTIARSLPGRTDNEIKNYWRTHFKKKAKAVSGGPEKAKIRLLKKQQFQQQQQQLQLMQQQQQERELSHQLDIKMFMSSMEEGNNYTTLYKPVTMPQVGSIRDMSASSHGLEAQLSYLDSIINSNNVSSSSIPKTLNEDMITWDGLWNLDDVHARHNLMTPFCL